MVVHWSVVPFASVQPSTAKAPNCPTGILQKSSLARALCEGLPLQLDDQLLGLVDGLRERVLHGLNVHKHSFSISLLLRLQIAKAADTKIFNHIWQKSEFRKTDLSETLRLHIVGVDVCDKHDRAAQRASLRQLSQARGWAQSAVNQLCSLPTPPKT